MPKFMLTEIRIAVIAMTAPVFLSACSSDGATTSSRFNTENASGIATTWVNPLRSTMVTTAAGAPASTVLVGVVDSDFDLKHVEISQQIQAYATFGATPPTGYDTHGTTVSQVLAGKQVGFSGNAKLLLASVEDSQGKLTSEAVNNGGVWVFSQGAKVANFSLSPLYQINGIEGMYDAAVVNKAAVIISAGNESASVSDETANQASLFSPGNETRKNVTLVVGALVSAKDKSKADYSNYAGVDANVQSRFLVAAGTNKVQPNSTASNSLEKELREFSGTSSSAPVVSAAAASLFAYWPHLTGQEVTSVLLLTANKSFSALYQQNNCGPSLNINCGLFNFGQGELDLAKAMTPVGGTNLPTGTSVGSAGSSLQATSLTLPPAFGNALQGKRLDAVVFDDYGRDFRTDLTRVMSAQQSRLSLADLDKPEESKGSMGPLNIRMQLQGKQNLGKLAMSYSGNKATFSLEHGLRSDATLSNYGFGLSRITSATGLDSAASQPTTTAVGMNWAMGSATSMQLRSEKGSALRASRNELGLTMRPAAGTSLTMGQSISSERALMGAQGSGGLAIDSSSGAGTFLRLGQDFADGWSLFGNAEIGSLAVYGNQTLTAVHGVRTSQFGIGLAHLGSRDTLGLAISQPLRADRAQADFKLATGRTLSGNVNYTTQTLSLTPSGRQIDFDISYKRRISLMRSVAVQATYSRDAGQIAGARDYGVAAKYSVAF